MADSVCRSTTRGESLLFPLLLPSNKRERLLLIWEVQHWSGLFRRYESTSKSWTRLYFPAYATYVWEKAAPTMKASLLDSGNNKNGPKVYALEVIIRLGKVDFLFWLLDMKESSRAYPGFVWSWQTFVLWISTSKSWIHFFYFSTSTESGCLLWGLWGLQFDF